MVRIRLPPAESPLRTGALQLAAVASECDPFLRSCANSALPFVHAFLASAYALKGETEHATAELTEAR
jgi:hypothetical protein